jgi:leader peptidase (prepilin peptidase)/N-methyltransferase
MIGSELPPTLVGVWVVLVGAVVGSFLNVVIARVPAGESVVRPRSRCPACGMEIAWYDNVPVVSWLVLRARCRRCGARISARYVVVELLGAAAAWLAWSRHGLGGAALAELAFVDLLLALALIDLATWLLPHVLTWPLIAGGLAASALGVSEAGALRPAALGAAAGFAAFALVAWVGKRIARKEALGFGDVWLLAGLGAWLGVSALLPVVLLASVQGSVYGLALLALGRGERGRSPEAAPPAPPDAPPGGAPPTVEGAAEDEDEDWVPPRNAVPFGPFLVAGALEWLYLGDWIAVHLPALGVFR